MTIDQFLESTPLEYQAVQERNEFNFMRQYEIAYTSACHLASFIPRFTDKGQEQYKKALNPLTFLRERFNNDPYFGDPEKEKSKTPVIDIYNNLKALQGSVRAFEFMFKKHNIDINSPITEKDLDGKEFDVRQRIKELEDGN